jgi:mono/diheme cytochrome c family protein
MKRGCSDSSRAWQRRALSWLVIPWLLWSCAGNRGEPLRGTFVPANKKVAHGQVVYMSKCNKCHPGGDAGLGPSLNNKPLPGFFIRKQIRRGWGAMPSFDPKEISSDDLDALVAYLKALRKQG